MSLSVIVPTLNARDELAGCLDALTEHVPDAEVIVVNGPSADGTSGMIHDRDDIDVLVELADRTITTARNAGIEQATGDVVAFLDHHYVISPGWFDAMTAGLEEADCVTGPTRSQLSDQEAIRDPETRRIAGREITYFNPGNVAFTADVLADLDGFDEYLEIGGSRDAAHRLAANDFELTWHDGMLVTGELGADGGEKEPDWGWRYRSLAYRLVKNYGLRPTVVWRLLRHATGDGYRELKAAMGGDSRPSTWFRNGRTVVANMAGGIKDGFGARRQDKTSRRNPRGRSSRSDRAVTVCDWR